MGNIDSFAIIECPFDYTHALTGAEILWATLVGRE